MKLDPSRREPDPSRGEKDPIIEAEDCGNFPEVEKKFKIIDSDTYIVLVDPDLIRKIEAFTPVPWQEIQQKSIQIWGYKLKEQHVPELKGHPGLYKWNLKYDSFLGYMAGVIENFNLSRNGGVL